MGADQIGFLFKGPVRLDRSRSTRAKAIAHGERVAAALRDHASGESIQVLLRHLSSDELEHLRDAPPPKPVDLVRDLLDWWRHGARDTCLGLDPDDPSQCFGFAGEMTWGDEPSGRGYQLLRDASRLDILKFFGIRGPARGPLGRASTTVQIRRHVKAAIDTWAQLDENRDVSGADLVEWFVPWRRRAKRLLRIRPPTRS